MFLCDFVLFCANKSIVSAPGGHVIQEVRGPILHSPCTKVVKISNIFFYLFVMRYLFLQKSEQDRSLR
jgi:hypothetical protein